MTKKKVESTFDRFFKSMTSQEKQEYEREYEELLLSEMILAAMEKDELSVRRLAKLAGVSPTIVQSMRSGTRKNFSMESFFKILKGLNCKIVIERDGRQVPLNLSAVNKKSGIEKSAKTNTKQKISRVSKDNKMQSSYEKVAKRYKPALKKLAKN